MIDSTNPRSMADNIRHLVGASGSQASDISTLQTTVEAQGDAIEALQAYSTTETDTGKIWIDSSPIYRRSFYMDDFTDVTLSGFDIVTGLTGINKIIDMIGVIANDSDNVYQLSNYLAGSNNSNIRYEPSGKIRAVLTGVTPTYIIVTIEYTKAAAPTLTSPAPDDSRSIEPEEIPEDEYIEPEVREEIPEEEPVVETKTTTRKRSTSTK